MTAAEEEGRSTGRGGRLRQMAATTAAFALYSLRRFNVDGCFAASGALSYTTLVSLVPLGVIALGSLSSFPIFAPVRDQLLRLVLGNFVPSIGEQAAWWFRAFAEFGNADDGDRRCRHRRDRHPAAGHRRGSAQPDLARHRAATLGAAHSLLLDIDNARPAADRDQPVALDLFRDCGAPGGLRAGSDGVAREQLAARPRARGAGVARIHRSHPALLPDAELCGALAGRRAGRGVRDRRDRDPEGRVLDLYRGHLLLQHGLRRARHHPDLPVVDVHLLDGGSPRRRHCRRLAELADRRADRHGSCRRGAARSEPGPDRRIGAGATARRSAIDAGARGRTRRGDDGDRRAHQAPRRGRFRRAYAGSGRWVLAWSPESATLHDLYEALHLPLAGRWTEQARRHGRGRWRRRWIGSSGPRRRRCR